MSILLEFGRIAQVFFFFLREPCRGNRGAMLLVNLWFAYLLWTTYTSVRSVLMRSFHRVCTNVLMLQSSHCGSFVIWQVLLCWKLPNTGFHMDSTRVWCSFPDHLPMMPNAIETYEIFSLDANCIVPLKDANSLSSILQVMENHRNDFAVQVWCAPLLSSCGWLRNYFFCATQLLVVYFDVALYRILCGRHPHEDTR